MQYDSWSRSNKVLLEVVYLFHFLEDFLLPVILALLPFFSKEFAVGDSFTEGEGVDEGVFKDAGVGPDAGDVVGIIILAEISELIGDIEVIELISRWVKKNTEYIF